MDGAITIADVVDMIARMLETMALGFLVWREIFRSKKK